MIEFRFIKNGLEKGEQCVYATSADSGDVVLKMLSYGIPLEYFDNKKLRVYQTQQSCGSRDEIMKSCKKDIEMILSGLQSPFRIVSRIVPDVSTINGISVELELERETHHRFDDIGGSVMCPYDLSKIEPSRRKEWISELGKNHHEVIYASKFGEGEVVSMSETKSKHKN